MFRVKSFRTFHKKALNSAVPSYRKRKKEINQLNQMAQFDNAFSICRMVAEYDVLYETLRGRIAGAWERHEAHTGAQRLAPEHKKLIAFQPNLIKPIQT